MPRKSAVRLAKLIKESLDKRGMSQRELQRKSGVHCVTINRLLHCTQEPTIDSIEKIAAALKIDIGTVFTKGGAK